MIKKLIFIAKKSAEANGAYCDRKFLKHGTHNGDIKSFVEWFHTQKEYRVYNYLLSYVREREDTDGFKTDYLLQA
jgi:hypothetical protein